MLAALPMKSRYVGWRGCLDTHSLSHICMTARWRAPNSLCDAVRFCFLLFPTSSPSFSLTPIYKIIDHRSTSTQAFTFPHRAGGLPRCGGPAAQVGGVP